MDASSDIFSVVQLLGATRWHATEVSLDPLATVEIGHWFIGAAVSSADAGTWAPEKVDLSRHANRQAVFFILWR